MICSISCGPDVGVAHPHGELGELDLGQQVDRQAAQRDHAHHQQDQVGHQRGHRTAQGRGAGARTCRRAGRPRRQRRPGRPPAAGCRRRSSGRWSGAPPRRCGPAAVASPGSAASRSSCCRDCSSSTRSQATARTPGRGASPPASRCWPRVTTHSPGCTPVTPTAAAALGPDLHRAQPDRARPRPPLAGLARLVRPAIRPRRRPAGRCGGLPTARSPAPGWPARSGRWRCRR